MLPPILHFYAGWPKAWAAFRLAKDVWAEDTPGEDAKAAFQREMIFPIGEPNTAYTQYFIGNSYLAPISTEQIPIFNVTFEPRCCNNWHIHRAMKAIIPCNSVRAIYNAPFYRINIRQITDYYHAKLPNLQNSCYLCPCKQLRYGRLQT